MKQAIWAVTLVSLGGFAGCDAVRTAEEQALIDQFSPVLTREDFVTSAVGPQWVSDEITVRFAQDGGLFGDINGVPVTGTWEWRGDQICTSFRVADSGGEGCSKLGLRPGELLVIPRGGAGAPYTYQKA